MSVETEETKEVVTPWECEHRKVLVTSELLDCDQMADATLAPLLTACLSRGIRSYTGCEDVGGDGYATVMFGMIDDAKALINICCDLQADSIHVGFVPPEDDEDVTVIEVSFPTWAIADITEAVLQAADDDQTESVTIHYVTDSGWLHTHDMDAHGLPELEIRDVPALLAEGASDLLQRVCDYMLGSGTRVRAGETMSVSPRTRIRFIKPEPMPGEDDHYGEERLQIVGLEPACECCEVERLSPLN
jgi:hypothetical protein